jgi:hypothetical protein
MKFLVISDLQGILHLLKNTHFRNIYQHDDKRFFIKKIAAWPSLAVGV